jgi:DNA repair exonuclease SbcCD ATPase subunit
MNKRLLYVYIKGFGVFHDEQRIDFRDLNYDEIIGIFGKNNDGDGGYDSNAAGKTTFTNAVSWGLFGKLPVQGDSTRAITKEQIVNHDSKKAIVGLCFQVGDEEIYFESSITSKGTKKLHLEINGEKFEANTDTQKRKKFYSLMGISGTDKTEYIDFLNRCYFSGDMTKSFASKNFSDKDRLNIVSRVKRMGVLDLASEKSKAKEDSSKGLLNTSNIELATINQNIIPNFSEHDISQNIIRKEQLLQDHEGKRDIIQAELEKYEKLLKLEKTKYEKQNALKEVEKDIDKILKEAELNVDKFNLNLEKMNSLKSQIDDEDRTEEIKKLEEELTLVKNSLDIVKANITALNITDDARRGQINELDTGDSLICPKCKSALFLDGKELKTFDFDKINTKIESLNEELEHSNATIKVLKEEQEKIETNRVLIQKEVEAFWANDYKNELLKKQIKDLLNESDHIVSRYPDFISIEDGVADFISHEYKAFTEWEEAKHEIEKIELELKNIGTIEYTLDDLNAEFESIKKLTHEIKELEDLIEDQEKWQSQHSLKSLEIEKYTAEVKKYNYWTVHFKKLKNIELIETEPELENSVNQLLAELGVGITTEFNVDVDNNELAINLIEDSGNSLPLELFSTGQANRISFAAGLALSELSSSSDNDYGFTMWDEVLDGLDNTGQDMFFDILRQKPGLKFVISHDQKLKGLFTQKLLVKRNNHKSIIELEI